MAPFQYGYQPKHAGGWHHEPERDTYQPRHAASGCPSCTPGANGVVCLACAGELAARLRDPDDELTVVYYGAHSPALHNWPPDVRGIA